MPGKVYIASMRLRGERASVPPSAKVINVTSAQSKSSEYRKAFSPMTPIRGGYYGFWNFEHFWQAGKKHADVPLEKTVQWWLKQDEPHRKCKVGSNRIEYAVYPMVTGTRRLAWVEARKEVYVPLYTQKVQHERVLQDMRELLLTKDIVILDCDGPFDENNRPICLEVTLDLLRTKIEDQTRAFGHGYVIAGLLLDILPNEYGCLYPVNPEIASASGVR